MFRQIVLSRHVHLTVRKTTGRYGISSSQAIIGLKWSNLSLPPCKSIQKCSPVAIDEHHVSCGRWLGHRFFSTDVHPPIMEEKEVYVEQHFKDLPQLDPRMKSALDKMGFSKMTEIQAKSYEPVALQGLDVLGRGQTGTGKTLAFLVPTLQRLSSDLGIEQNNKIQMLILSPTRELALQIDSQVKALTVDMQEVTHQTLFGGTSKVVDVKKLEANLPTILVATPGRLCDHMRGTSVNGESFRNILQRVQILILDEADRYIDMGSDIPMILNAIPKKRQTLLFSATLPHSVLEFLRQVMRPNYVRVDTISGETDQTNKIVGQSHVILPSSQMVTGAVKVIRHIMDIPDAKVIVFFPTTSMVAFFAKIFNFGLGGKYVLEIHSKKTQTYRTSVSNRFRELERGALFTSDVSARGVDYPGITHVVQVALPSSQESYIHRLGRTGRAGSTGQGVLILAETERGFLDILDDGIHVPLDKELQGLLESGTPSKISRDLKPVIESISVRTNEALVKAAEETYRSLLGYYNGKLGTIGVKGLPKLVEFCNTWAAEAGLSETPTIGMGMAKAVGLDEVPGINLARNERTLRSRVRRKEKKVGYHGDDRLSGRGNYGSWGKNLKPVNNEKTVPAKNKMSKAPAPVGWFN